MNSFAVVLLCILAGIAMHLYQVIRLLAWIERRTRWERRGIRPLILAESTTEAASSGLRAVGTGHPDDLIQQQTMPLAAVNLAHACGGSR